MCVSRGEFSKGAGRPRIRERPDLRVTVRFRYHCDQDIIQALQEVRNRNKFIRNALRRALAEKCDKPGD